MVVLAAAASFLLLMAAGRRTRHTDRTDPVTFIALGIGLHNLGEGLAIGAAFASGAAGLGTFLVLGFTLHNVTEGIGIAAPVLRQRPPLKAFAGLRCWRVGRRWRAYGLGASPTRRNGRLWLLAIGAGAILQVIVEVMSMVSRESSGEQAASLHQVLCRAWQWASRSCTARPCWEKSRQFHLLGGQTVRRPRHCVLTDSLKQLTFVGQL